MTHRTAASRYARALFDVAMKEKADLTGIESELVQFRAVIAGHPDLSKALLNPAVPAPRKRAAVAELAAAVRVSRIVAKLLTLLGERDRFVLFDDLIDSYRQRLLDHQNVVRAEITTASALSDDRTRDIEQSLARATGRTVRLSSRVDPSIIGGIIARVGGTVYDASITNHLQRLKHRLDESL